LHKSEHHFEETAYKIRESVWKETKFLNIFSWKCESSTYVIYLISQLIMWSVDI